MALTEILQSMERQVRAEVARVKTQAAAEAAAIGARGEEEARLIKTRHLADVLPRLQNERARLLNSAKMAALREVMAAREDLLEQAFAAAQTALASLRKGPDYPRYLTRLVGEVVAELGRELRIMVDSRDEPLMRRIATDLGLQAQVSKGLHTLGGLEASTPDGSVGVVNTLDMRLERGWPQLRREIASLLAAEAPWKATMTMPMPASGQ